MEPIVKAYINEAIEIEKAGLKVNSKRIRSPFLKSCKRNSMKVPP